LINEFSIPVRYIFYGTDQFNGVNSKFFCESTTPLKLVLIEIVSSDVGCVFKDI
jgi:hypothetical protein